MKFPLHSDRSQTIEIPDLEILATINAAYTEWYYGHDGRIDNPDETLRLVLKGNLLDTYNKNWDLRKVMQYIMDYTCNKSCELVQYIAGHRDKKTLTNTDGTPLSDFERGLLLHFSAWTKKCF